MTKKIGRGGRCQSLTVTGNACRMRAVRGERYCFSHSPTLAKARTAARRRGGARKRTMVLGADTPEVSFESAAATVKLLATITGELLRGAIDPKVATAAGFLINLAMKAREASDLERRLSALEALNERQPIASLLDEKLDDENGAAA
jgi:hypothetical protein